MAGPPPKKMGMSLYADLLDPEKKATISGAPVRYEMKKDADEEVQKKKDASLMFQPYKRPQTQQKTKPKGLHPSSSHKFSSSTATLSASSPEKQLPTNTPHQQPSVQRSRLEDWVGDEDEDSYYQERARTKGRNKNKKKNQGQFQEPRIPQWDDIYDPTQPNIFMDYKGSDEQMRENRDWKARLYYHMRDANGTTRNGVAGSDQNGESSRPMNRMFAPPSNMSFAPPSFDDEAYPRASIGDEYDYSYGRRRSHTLDPALSFAPPPVSNDATGEDAYMRRMRMGGIQNDQPNAPSPPAAPPGAPATAASIPSTISATQKQADIDLEAKRAEAQAKIAAFKAKLLNKASKPEASALSPPQTTVQPPASMAPSQQTPPPPPPPPPVEEPGSTISRGPVRYEQPPPPPDSTNNDDTMADVTEGGAAVPVAELSGTYKPGKKDFGQRLLKKYGWEKGQGLGAKGEGITTALVAKVDKRLKLPDSEGGGWVQPANMGKIVGGKRRKVEADDSAEQVDPRFGAMSEVIKIEGMLNGLDVQDEIENKDLYQEIGTEMGSYGNVERIVIWREEQGGGNEVFVKFTSPLGALKAVNETDGVTFADNQVVARFWDAEKFENGQYA